MNGNNLLFYYQKDIYTYNKTEWNLRSMTEDQKIWEKRIYRKNKIII